MLNFSEIGTQIRIAWRAKYNMLPCDPRMFLKASGENFLSTAGMHTHFRSVLFINIAYSGGINTCWNPNFYFVVLNQFCDPWLKIRMACSTL